MTAPITPTPAASKPLGPPRLFVEVIREVGDTGQYIRSRKEISELVWRQARHGSVIIETEIEACFRECESYGH